MKFMMVSVSKKTLRLNCTILVYLICFVLSMDSFVTNFFSWVKLPEIK